jgi:hypothetical protein
MGGNNRCITIIDIESKKVMTTIPMDTVIYGMAVRGRAIYYCTGNKGLRMLNQEHPVINIPLMLIFWFRFRCILSTDIGGDMSATIIWACLSFFLAKVNSQGFDSTSTSPNF